MCVCVFCSSSRVVCVFEACAMCILCCLQDVCVYVPCVICTVCVCVLFHCVCVRACVCPVPFAVCVPPQGIEPWPQH